MRQEDYKELLGLLDYWYETKTGMKPPKGNSASGSQYSVVRSNTGEIKIITGSKPATTSTQSNNKPIEFSNPLNNLDVEKGYNKLKNAVREVLVENMPNAGKNMWTTLMASNPLTYLLWQNRDIFSKGANLAVKGAQLGVNVANKAINKVGTGASKLLNSFDKLKQNTEDTSGNTNQEKLATMALPKLTPFSEGGNTSSADGILQAKNVLITKGPNYIIAEKVMVLGKSEIIESMNKGISKLLPDKQKKLGVNNRKLLPGGTIPLLPGSTESTVTDFKSDAEKQYENTRFENARKIQVKSIKTTESMNKGILSILKESIKTNKLLNSRGFKTLAILAGIGALVVGFKLLKDKFPQIIEGIKQGFNILKNGIGLIWEGIKNIIKWLQDTKKIKSEFHDTMQQRIVMDSNNINTVKDVTKYTGWSTPNLIKHLGDTFRGKTVEQLNTIDKTSWGDSNDKKYNKISTKSSIIRTTSNELTPIYSIIKGRVVDVILYDQTKPPTLGIIIAPFMELGKKPVFYKGLTQTRVWKGSFIQKGQIIGFAEGSVQILTDDPILDSYMQFAQDLESNNYGKAKDIMSSSKDLQSQPMWAQTYVSEFIKDREKSIRNSTRADNILGDKSNDVFNGTRSYTPSSISGTSTKVDGGVFENSQKISNANTPVVNAVTQSTPIILPQQSNQKDNKIVTIEYGISDPTTLFMASGGDFALSS